MSHHIVSFSPIRPARLQFDHQGTPVSSDFNDIYFSQHNGLAESRHVFLQGNQLAARFPRHPRGLFIVAETGFGCGINFLALWQAFEQFRQQHPHAPLQRLQVISIEKYPLTAADLGRVHQRWPELAPYSEQLCQQWPVPLPGCQRLLFAGGRITLDLWLGDIHEVLHQPDSSLWQQIDAWFLDGFAPAKNPEMWSARLFQAMATLTRPGGSVATFSAAGVVRRGLQQVGFITEKQPGFAGKRDMLTARLPAAFRPASLTHPQPWYQRCTASQPAEIAIIGGGIASALLALALLRRGSRITLYCADARPAQGASGNRQGAIYPPLNLHDPLFAHYYYTAFGFARRLYDTLPVDIAHGWCGVSQLAISPRQRENLHRLAQSDIPEALARALDAQQASQACGLPVEHPAIEYPDGGWISPQQLTCALLDLACQQGARIHYQHQVTSLHYHTGTAHSPCCKQMRNNEPCQPDEQHSPAHQQHHHKQQHHEQHQHQQPGWHLCFANGHTRHHPVLVLANGWQISQFTQTADLPVTPVAGQVSHVSGNAELAHLRQVLCYEGYLTPCHPASHSHCLGASYHHWQTSTDYREQDQHTNRQQLIDSLAAQQWPKHIELRPHDARTGVRCMVRDHLPLVGNAPDYPATLACYSQLAKQAANPATVPAAPYHPDLFILAALGSRGLCNAPLAAEILAAQIYGEPQPLDSHTLNALNTNRVWIRKLLAGRIVTSRRCKITKNDSRDKTDAGQQTTE